MYCKTCNYSLWNLRDRRCPECGSAFKPSDFRFVPGSVRFCCPHCAQAYYGTTPEGHLQPRSFLCVNCRQPVEMDQTIVVPAAGVDEELTSAERMPWLDDSPGFFRRWFKTIGWSMTSPSKLIAGTALTSSLGRAFWFAFLTLSLYYAAMIIPLCGVVAFSALSALSRGRTGGPAMFSGMFVGFAIWAVTAILVTLASFLFWAFISHALLRVGGPTEGGLRRTMQCFLYSSGAFVLVAVPCVGPYLSVVCWVWSAVSAIHMICRGQRVGGGRASFAVLTPPITLTILGALGLVLWLIPAISSTVTAAQAAATQAAAQAATAGIVGEQQNAQLVLDSLRRHADAPPGHAARLVAWGDVAPTQFVLSQRPDTPGADAIVVGRTTLQDLFTAAKSAQERELRRAEGALPPNVTAHRVGDFVFTYHGVDMANGVDGLWLFIAEVRTAPPALPAASAPSDPSSRRRSRRASVPTGQSIWLVGTNAGEVHTVSDLLSATYEQNQLRAAQGLAPLPAATEVKDVWPAPAPDPPPP
jgi:hypothetical protein